MPYKIRLKNISKQFVVEHGETILEAALKAGLNVAYGCNNGNCGLCAARLLNGKVSKIKSSDYAFSTSLKVQHYFLMCANTPASDIDITAEVADSSTQIPVQYFRAKLSKVERIAERLAVVRMRVARSHRLRFMAGQSVFLKHSDYGNHRLAIASCPCDAGELEFHIKCDDNQAPRSFCEQYRIGEWFDVEGPYDSFTFSEDLARTAVLIACDTGFAACKSLIEHIVAQDSEVPVHLYRTNLRLPIYMENLCFAWRDALDQFSYSTLAPATNPQSAVANWSLQIADDYPELRKVDFYLCLPHKMLLLMKPALIERGALPQHIFSTAVGETDDT
ncbi:MAG: 2Fe-2S iron-sulfur cluster binding domain-containing protein [Chromatiales bacterium]|nr:2Fe-2S iron-sulfur cluster binding domain-containing protein [Chromatiales bacterium]